MQAARTVLYELIRDSNPKRTFKEVALQIGERPDTLSTRLRDPGRTGYGTLDTAMVINICAVLGVPVSEFFKQVEVRAEELLHSEG